MEKIFFDQSNQELFIAIVMYLPDNFSFHWKYTVFNITLIWLCISYSDKLFSLASFTNSGALFKRRRKSLDVSILDLKQEINQNESNHVSKCNTNSTVEKSMKYVEALLRIRSLLIRLSLGPDPLPIEKHFEPTYQGNDLFEVEAKWEAKSKLAFAREILGTLYCEMSSLGIENNRFD